ncbi:hybrid sensor histidine kinase/response regulator [Dyella nitratireducens]|uniref:histidine kinase n=1 Tax=Dyella nitratireducens TaxID=1849580 RepID=A0ABQ1FP70_9GAMM|nr:PAS domain-containing sensor histidine kinase [Dyella nitratireducens]GGA24744.1 histidine kinase [Dyella nitratireducens]GLQ43784.1 histidine kinase [Dyella nitratireducens]
MLKELLPTGAAATVPSSENVLKTLPVAIYTTDAQGRITFFNDAAVAFAGRQPAIGEMWCVMWRLFRPDGTPLPHDQCPTAIALRERRPVHDMEVIAERPDGKRVPFMPHPTPLFDENGELIGVINTLVDLTDPKHVQAQLEQAQALAAQQSESAAQDAEMADNLGRFKRDFELLVGSVTDYAIFMLDTTGYITSWNSGAERIKGYRAEDIIGRHFSVFYTPEDLAADIPRLALTTALHGGRFETEGWRVRKDGTRFWAIVVIDPVWDNGQLIGFAEVTRDATTRRNAELALFESERRFRGIVNNALDAFAQIDEAGRVTEWNPQAHELFGWSREQALGKPLTALCFPSNDTFASEWLVSAWQKKLTRQTHQLTAMNRSGRRFTAELSASVLTLASGPLMNIFMRDLTQKIQMETQLRQSQKMEALGQLTGGIAHDFNNILQAISSSLEVVEIIGQREGFIAGDKHIQNALSSVRRAAGLTHRLLAFARRQALDPQAVDVGGLIAGMSELLRHSIGEHIALELALPDALWTAHCDTNQLENAILNLAINARDAMPKGGRLRIEAANISGSDPNAFNVMDPDSSYIKIVVADSGTGMPPDVKERAFDPFYTTKPVGQGTGLGLSMVYGFARQSGGHCVIESELGEGTRIILLLPRYVGPVQSHVELVATADRPAASGEHILLVEDQDVIRDAVTEVLGKLGYEVTQASDGLEGLSIAMAGQTFDLIITDIGLPGVNGRSLADTVRSQQPYVPVLLVTGYDPSVVHSSPSLPAGMALLSKPFNVDALNEQVRRLLEWRHAQREARNS